MNFCNACSSSSIYIRWPSRMPARPISIPSWTYGDGIFIVARTAQMVEGRIAFGETHLFVGRGYVVSVRHGASVSYAAVRQRCEACPTVLSQGEDYIVYAILDFIVDNYMPVVEKIQAEVEAIEDTVLATTLSQNDIERLYLLRRDLLRLRNAAGISPPFLRGESVQSLNKSHLFRSLRGPSQLRLPIEGFRLLPSRSF